ncbi:MAG: hypothetical protein WCY09_09405 [Candidatus Omnitrophota bacterium]|jgi:hypothetical protein
MPDLTLEQVRKAGRFAWLDEPQADGGMWFAGFLFVGGQVFMANTNGGRFDSHDAPPSVDHDGYEHNYVWHHLPGCDCEYCA